MNILLTIQPASGVTAPSALRADVEVYYLREITDDKGAIELVPATIRTALDVNLKGTISLENVSGDSLEVTVLSIDGSSLLKKVLPLTEKKTALLELNEQDISVISSGGQVIPTDTTPLKMVRTARLVPVGNTKVDYSRSSVIVAPIVDASALTSSGIDTILKNDGTRITSLEVTGQNLNALNTLAWYPSELAVDGTITASFKQQSTIGWLWWLIGNQQAFGFIPDDLNVSNNKTLIIALPPLSPPTETNSGTREKDSNHGRSVPANVTEAELANNPDIYTEDPGAFCRPFSNPERVLSEKSFSVIARVTQPDIGPLGSVNTKTVSILNLDEKVKGSLAPVMAMLPARHNVLGRYLDLLKRLPSGRTNMDANHPLQWEDDIAQYQSTTVAIGHILEFRVRWRSNGYSLGNVAKTLTLAPRQTKRIQKIEWERSERARRTEQTQLRDQENDSVVRERDYDDSVASHLNEWASGGSSSKTKAIAGGLGFFLGGFLGGIGGGAASAQSTSHQEGGRDTTASEQQHLRDSIRRHGDALRKFESTVVDEVTQEETVTGTTEVIRNANYAHSLTVIYYQILRHLKVNTEFAGVRECIFVPFAIKAFDVQRAYRWREALQAFIRSPLYSRALRYLKDVATNFTTSNITAGPRANQKLTYLRGSIYVSLGVERPTDTLDGKFDANSWSVTRPLLGSPANSIFSILAGQIEAQRDRAFQAEYAPTIAAKWANNLTLNVESQTRSKPSRGSRNNKSSNAASRLLHADCTLASRYQFNRTVRIDFVVSGSELSGLTRQGLQQLTIKPFHGLPPGSVANLTRLTLTYSTERYEHTVEGQTGTNDLINPVNGEADGATVFLPLDQWEQVDEQLEIRRSVSQLVEHLNEHVEYYHKAIWWRMDRDRLMMMLDGFYVPNTNNVSIASVVDREPVGIIGNSIVYRVGAASFLGYGKVTTPAQLYNVYAQKEPVSDPLLISLPTDGLYAQTIMDECAALEEHYGNTDWVLNDKNPDLGVIDPSLLQSRRADQTVATTPTPFPSTIINLQNAPEAPAPSGLADVLNAVTNANAFRDMAGLAGTQANARSALETAANLATNFGNQAAALELAKLAKAQEATRTADQKLASIKRAEDKGLTTAADAAQATKDVLSAMNPDSLMAGATEAKIQQDISKNLERLNNSRMGEMSLRKPDGTEVTTKFSDSSTALVPVENRVGRGGVTPIRQDNAMACWATVATMMMRWKDSRNYTIEEVLAKAGQRYVDYYHEKRGLPYNDKNDFISALGMRGEPPASYSAEAYREFLLTYGPLWVTTDADDSTGFSAHALLVTGISNDLATLEVIDPANGSKGQRTFQDFSAAFSAVVTDGPTMPSTQVVHFAELLDTVAEGSGDTASDRARDVNEYNPEDETSLVINTMEFTTGITSIRNYKDWKTNAAILHNPRKNGYRDPFNIKQIVLHETAADVGDGFDDTNNTTSHMSVKKDATILQFNDLVEFENHTIGLNSTAIGIEFVNRGWLSSSTQGSGEGIPSSESALTASQKENYKEANGYLWTFWGYGFNIYKLPSSMDQLEKEVELVNWVTTDLQIILNGISGVGIFNMFPWIDAVWPQLVSYDDVKDLWSFRDVNIPPDTERSKKNLFVMTTGYDYLTPSRVKTQTGIVSHNAVYEGHSDGSFLAAYTWLRIAKGKNNAKAFELCKTLMKQHWFRVTPKSDSDKRIVILDVKDANLV